MGLMVLSQIFTKDQTALSFADKIILLTQQQPYC